MTTNLRAWASLALCMPLALLGACATKDKPAPVAVRAVIQSPGRSTVAVSADQDGASIVLEASQELRVDLPIDVWSISNNFDWSVVDLRPGVLDVLGSRFERGTRGSNSSDVDGTTTWRIKPQAPGRVSLRFELRRRHSLEPATQIVSFDVTVK